MRSQRLVHPVLPRAPSAPEENQDPHPSVQDLARPRALGPNPDIVHLSVSGTAGPQAAEGVAKGREAGNSSLDLLATSREHPDARGGDISSVTGRCKSLQLGGV